MKDLNIHVRKAESGDIEKIIDIHMQSLPDSLSAKLGRCFLRRKFLPHAISCCDVIVLVLEKDNDILGFSVATRTASVISRELSRHKFEIFLSILKRIFSDPLLLWHCLASVKKTCPEWTEEPPHAFFYLFLIAIEPKKQGSGLGAFLLDYSLQEAAFYFKEKQCVVDARMLDSYNFYLKNGFRAVGQELRGSRRFFKLLREID